MKPSFLFDVKMTEPKCSDGETEYSPTFFDCCFIILYVKPVTLVNVTLVFLNYVRNLNDCRVFNYSTQSGRNDIKHFVKTHYILILFGIHAIYMAQEVH